MDEYRKRYREQHKEQMKTWKKEDFVGLLDVIIAPRSVDMKEFNGTDKEIARAIEYLYANDGRAFNPKLKYPPSMLDKYGKEYALNARGIYYHNDFSPDLVTLERKVWIPTLEGVDWEEPSECDRRQRARVLMEHNINNETRHKSEYAWEADAWNDVFGSMRNDPCLEADKHDYYTELREVDPVSCTLTGKSTVAKRTPDATFGLATFSKSRSNPSVWADELSRERLEKLLLHRKCGLLADPKWGETDLVFPFAAYEAKGWSGDCREARRQACQGAACYLDMLDNLARTPGQVGSTKVYQTKTSHQYQVFVLTSFGAHWHLLVEYRRPRQKHEHAGMEGLSDTVYVFQRIWSARVINERTAWELLSLVDQIHLWAITEFRTFVLEHLRPWHKFCDDNYILDWKSVYNVGPELKWTRTCSESDDLLLPSWVNLMKEPVRQKIQARAKNSLAKALAEHRRRKGKQKYQDESGWRCMKDECSTYRETTYDSNEAFVGHLRSVHHYQEDELAKIKRCLNEADEKEKDEDNEYEMLSGSEIDADTRNNKRRLNEERLNDNARYDFSRCDPGPSKRVRVA